MTISGAITTENCFRWPHGQRCSVSLTYDDALPIHHAHVAPLLASRGLSATFNVLPHASFTENTDPWKRVAALGHELGNHSLFHPCRREPPERYTWLAPQYDLCQYTRQRWSDELRVANCLLRMIDGRTERTFGNTCCHTTIGQGKDEVRFDDIVASLFVAARGPLNDSIIVPDSLRYTYLGHFSGDSRTAAELRQLVERARSQGGWIIFMFHGVGADTHKLFIESEQHQQFIDYLSAESRTIWTASMVDVATHLKRSGYAAVP